MQMSMNQTTGGRPAHLCRGLGRGWSFVLALACAAAGVGCSTVSAPRVEMADTRLPPVVAAPVAPAPLNGALFQASQYRPLFEDHRARVVGDALTVNIVERVSAAQSSTSSLDKNGSIDASISSLPLVSANSFARAGAKAQSAAGFSGKGATENTNDFSGTITAVVTGVLPNGHLQIAGEKQIGVNHNVDVLRFTGQVDPRSIQPGNVVPSALIANVRVEHRGRGAQGETTSVGWLSRFFLSLWPV
jgi:flagellar L-ring protein precursor FlgH